jgi:hypothetical protein
MSREREQVYIFFFFARLRLFETDEDRGRGRCFYITPSEIRYKGMVVSSGAKISPRRREPKKEVVAAHQKTCFVSGSQGDLAILDPMVIKRGMVTTRRVLEDG